MKFRNIAFSEKNLNESEREPLPKAVFAIEAAFKFPGYKEDYYWNGWACPWFEKEIADKIAEGRDGKFDETSDSYIFEYDDGSEDVFMGKDVKTVDGVKHLYPIGNKNWVWDIVEESLTEDAKSNEWIELFTEFLNMTEFDLIKVKDAEGKDAYALRDRQGGNIGDIESDYFYNAEQIFERMDAYIIDYILESISEQLDDDDYFGGSCEDFVNWYTPEMQEKYPELKGDIAFCDLIANHPKDVNLEIVAEEPNEEQLLGSKVFELVLFDEKGEQKPYFDPVILKCDKETAEKLCDIMNKYPGRVGQRWGLEEHTYMPYGNKKYDVLDKDAVEEWIIDIKAKNGEDLDESLQEDWTVFEYAEGNPYIAKTEKEKQRILNKYKDRVKEVKKGFYFIDNTKSDKFISESSKLKEEYGAYKGSYFLEQVADQLEGGNSYGYVGEHEWEATIYGNAELTSDNLSPRAYDYMLQEISYPVRDGHLSYSDLDILLYNNGGENDDFTKEDLELIGFDKEDIKKFFSKEDVEIECWVDYEIDTGDYDIEDDLYESKKSIKENPWQVQVDGKDSGTFDNEADAYREKSSLEMQGKHAEVVELDGDFDKEPLDVERCKDILNNWIDWEPIDNYEEDVDYAIDQLRNLESEGEITEEEYDYIMSNWDELLDTSEINEKLIQGKSDKTLKKNIATEIKAGKDPKQAYAIAKSIQDKNKKECLYSEKLSEKELAALKREYNRKITKYTDDQGNAWFRTNDEPKEIDGSCHIAMEQPGWGVQWFPEEEVKQMTKSIEGKLAESLDNSKGQWNQAEVAKEFGVYDELKALEKDLLKIKGITNVDFDLSGLYDGIGFVLIPEIDVEWKNFFEDRHRIVKEIRKVASAHGIESADPMELSDEYIYWAVRFADQSKLAESTNGCKVSHKGELAEDTQKTLTEDVAETKAEALADYLKLKPSEVFNDDYDKNSFATTDGDYYLVLDEEEAREYAERDIRNVFDDLGLDSFTPSFQEWILHNAVDEEWFEDTRYENYTYYVDDLENESDEVFENRLISELVDADILKEEDFDNWGEDNPTLKEDIDIDSKKREYVDYLCDGDPIAWYENEFGFQELSDLVRKGLGPTIDMDAIVEECIKQDGIAHFVASYDGQEIDLGNGLYAYRT